MKLIFKLNDKKLDLCNLLLFHFVIVQLNHSIIEKSIPVVDNPYSFRNKFHIHKFCQLKNHFNTTKTFTLGLQVIISR